MFSYRHGFHAGNHADVLKHFVMAQIMAYLNQKETPYTYVDTHAGAGVYQLNTGYAAKTAEYETGIARLWNKDDLPAPLADYVDMIRSFNPEGKLLHYPGSPFCAEKLSRDEDRLRLFEMHPNEVKVLVQNCGALEEQNRAAGLRRGVRGKRVIIGDTDGFDSLKSLLPPPSRRAFVLIDPPYEVKDDYRKVKVTLDEAIKRFPGGVYAVWYPVLQRLESRQFPDKLKRIACKDWLHVTLTVKTPTPDGVGGFHSSGMFILNPPWTLENTLREIMPYLTAALDQDGGARFTLESGSGTPPKPAAPAGSRR